MSKKWRKWFLKEDEFKQYATPELKKESERYGTQRIQNFLFWRICKEIAKAWGVKYSTSITVRKLYYSLVSEGIIVNNERSYQNFDVQLGNARRADYIDPSLFEDRSRETTFPYFETIYYPPKNLIKGWIESVLEMPPLDIWNEQDFYVELMIEKDALLDVFKPFATKWQIPLSVGRGYTSISKKSELSERIKKSDKQKAVLLYAGDLDPSGWTISQTLQDFFDDKELDVFVDRVALNLDQVDGLISQPVKEKDNNTPEFQRLFPELNGRSYELDAIDFDYLQGLLLKAIQKYFDQKKVDNKAMDQWRDEFKKETSLILDLLKF